MTAASSRTRARTGGDAPFARPRTAARLYAVQALYQLAQQDAEPASIVAEFDAHRLGEPPAEGLPPLAPDRAFFRDVVTGVGAHREEIDAVIGRHLPDSWPIHRLDPVLLAILRAGSYELMARPDIPTAALINDYLLVTALFFDERERAFINGVLDGVAQFLRAGA